MTLNIALQIDPPAELMHEVDTSFVIAREIIKRGHTLFYLPPDSVSLHNGDVVGNVTPFMVHAIKQEPAYTLGKGDMRNLADMDVILIRQNPPVNMAYMSNALMLARLDASRTLVLNRPSSLMDFPEKIIPTFFPEFTPSTLISRDLAQIRSFYRAHGEVVVKPLFGYGGKSIFKLSKSGANVEAILETLMDYSDEPFVIQQFLPEVTREEKRIILIDGEVVGVFGRIPAEDDIRSNMRVGGTPIGTTLTSKQKQIAEAVGAFCKQHGFLLVGLDVIGDWLIEVNVTSPTGFVPLNTLYGLSPEAIFMDAIEKSLG